jgi:hypothetical protein
VSQAGSDTLKWRAEVIWQIGGLFGGVMTQELGFWDGKLGQVWYCLASGQLWRGGGGWIMMRRMGADGHKMLTFRVTHRDYSR